MARTRYIQWNDENRFVPEQWT